MRGLARARHVMHVHPKRVTHAMGEERRAHARRKHRRFVGAGPEDSKPLEAPHECAVAQQLNRIPMQARSDRLEGGLAQGGGKEHERHGDFWPAYRLHLEDELVDRACLRSEFATVAYRHRARD